MTKHTHVIAGITAALAIGASVPQVAICALGALLPDIDHSGSALGSKVPWVGKLITHRGVTHSLLFCVVMCLISPYLALGVATHILLDSLNPSGVQLLWPKKSRIKIPLIKIRTGSGWEFAVYGCLMIGFFVSLAHWRPQFLALFSKLLGI